MAEETTRFKIPYPSEGQASYYGVFESMMNTIDSLDYANFEERNSVMHGGGTVTWEVVGADNVAWSANIEIVTPSHGQKIVIPPSATLDSATGLGGISIPSGNFMYVDASRGPTVTVNLTDVEVAPQLPISSVSQIIAYRDPTTGSLFFATNLVLATGQTSGTGILLGVAAPATEPYVVMSASATLTNERILTGSGAITVTDGGAGGNATLALANTAVTPGSYTKADITVDASGRLTAASDGSTNGLISSEALVKRRQEVSGTYTVDSNAILGPDVIIGADTSAAAVIINLPSAALQTSGRMLTIHDLGDAATNKVGISPDGSDTINGAVDSLPTAYAMEITTDYGSVTLVCDGTSKWFAVFST